MKKYLKSLPPKTLLDESVVMFIGSRSIVYVMLLARPKNLQLRNELIQIAIEKASISEANLISKMTQEQKEKFLVSPHHHLS